MPAQDHHQPITESGSLLLVAAPEPLIRRMLQGVLSDAGYRVLTAGSRTEVMAACRQHNPDLVLLDLGDPGSRDFALCAALQDLRDGRPMPLIALADHGGAGVVEQVFNAGAADFLLKPVDPTLLKAKIRRELEHSAVERALQLRRVSEQAVPSDLHLGHWQYDPETRLLHLSCKLDAALHLSKAPAGQHLTQLLRRVHADDRRDVRAAFRRAIHLGRSYDLNHRLLGPDGSPLWVHHQVIPVRHPSNGHFCLTGQLWHQTDETPVTTDASQAVPPFGFSSNPTCQSSDPAHH